MGSGKIRVLVVEDTQVMRSLLVAILSADPELEVVAVARDGVEAIALIASHRPDVITMDIVMPRMGGLEATRRIMETTPVPIVIVSGSVGSPTELTLGFDILKAGAVAALPLPRGPGDPGFQESARELVQTVKLMSEVKLVRRMQSGPEVPRRGDHPPPATEDVAPLADVRAVGIGASAGGPPVLQAILSGLPPGFAAPVLVVQHIDAGFVDGLVAWLAGSAALPVSIATDGQRLEGGCVYVAPGGRQMGVGPDGRIILRDDPAESGLRPAVSYLFRSLAEVFGARAIGVLLTGMGADGAAALKLMRDRGAVTIAQDQASSLVFGMPGEAVKLGAARYVLPPDRIVELVSGLVSGKRQGVALPGVDPAR